MLEDDWFLKIEVFRVLDPRWIRHRCFILRETGYTWVEIAHALDMHESTIRNYYREGEREAEHDGTLNYFLSERARKWLLSKGIDPTATDAALAAQGAIALAYGQRRSGLGLATRNEILTAIELLHVRLSVRN